MTQPNVWEYVVEKLPSTTLELEKKLDLYGKDNWELCGIIQGYCIIFKRHIFRTDI